MEHPSLTLRPYGIVIRGQLELGLELVIAEGQVQEIRPHTGVPEDFVISAPFVNAHSHLEYRGLMGRNNEPEYWSWIREITRLKMLQTPEEVRADCLLAAHENVRTGVAYVAEHSDRPYSGEAMRQHGLDGVIFQEIITFFEKEKRLEKLRLIDHSAAKNEADFGEPTLRAVHAYYTVDRETMDEVAQSGRPFSMHVAETGYETEFTRNGGGPIGEFYKANGKEFEPSGKDIVSTLADLGLVRRGAQFVHCCALEEGDIELLAEHGVVVAHCPRSNTRLKCPEAPLRELLDAGVPVGLGLDSAASSGPIDMFAEMREAELVSRNRGAPLTPEEVWWMATGGGAESLRQMRVLSEGWEVESGYRGALLRIEVAGAHTVEDLIQRGSPDVTELISLSEA